MRPRSSIHFLPYQLGNIGNSRLALPLNQHLMSNILFTTIYYAIFKRIADGKIKCYKIALPGKQAIGHGLYILHHLNIQLYAKRCSELLSQLVLKAHRLTTIAKIRCRRVQGEHSKLALLLYGRKVDIAFLVSVAAVTRREHRHSHNHCQEEAEQFHRSNIFSIYVVSMSMAF